MKFRVISQKSALPLMLVVALCCLVVGLFVVPGALVRANPTSPTLQSTSSFYTGRGGWLALPTTFTDKVVHFSLTETIYIKQDAGPDRNTRLLGDAWEQIGANGELQKYHVVYTDLTNNTFYQEIYEDSSTYLVVFNQKDAPHQLAGSSATSCILQMPAHSLAERNKDLIPFANTQEMQKEGFSVSSQTRAVSQTVPQVLSSQKSFALAGVAPVAQYANPTSVHVWTLTQTPTTGGTRLHHVELDASSRVVFEYAAFSDANGNVLSSTTFAFGPAVLYNPQGVASGALSSAQQIQAGGCSR